MAIPRVLGMIMAGGRGERLDPLTRERSKPAVPFGGRYRIVDFVLSNCINSGIHAIYLLIQYKSQSLIEHIRLGWRREGLSSEQFITMVPPQMRWQNEVWYRGTADAVFQNLNLIHDFQPDIVAVFGADHIYRMDIRQMVQAHLATGADVTVAARPVPVSESSDFGIVQVDASHRVTGFQEKPSQPIPMPQNSQMALSSMGNYLFNRELLIEVLEADAKQKTDHDFGRTLIPGLVSRAKVYGYDLQQNEIRGIKPYEERGYWRDVGSLDSFWRANMDLLGHEPRFDLANPLWPIHASGYDGPPTKVIEGTISDSLMSEGSVVHDAVVRHSILGRGVRIDPGCVIEDSIIMDYTHVQSGAHLTKTIIDRYNVIPAQARIGGSAHNAAYGTRDDSGLVVLARGLGRRRRMSL